MTKRIAEKDSWTDYRSETDHLAELLKSIDEGDAGDTVNAIKALKKLRRRYAGDTTRTGRECNRSTRH